MTPAPFTHLISTDVLCAKALWTCAAPELRLGTSSLHSSDRMGIARTHSQRDALKTMKERPVLLRVPNLGKEDAFWHHCFESVACSQIEITNEGRNEHGTR
jgi:hypothetical protein